MNVSIDTNWLYMVRRGCARYVRGLLLGLDALRPPDVRWTEVAWPVNNYAFRQPGRALRTLYRELVWARLAAPAEIRRQQADVLHVTHPLLAHARHPVKVTTLYDFAIMHNPERFRPWSRYRLKRYVPRIRESDALVCISRFTADEAIRFAGVPPKKLFVTHLASEFTLNDARSREQAPPRALPDTYFLFVGALEPGKNLNLMLRVYELARQRRLTLPPLLVVGERMQGVAQEDAVSENLVYLGHVKDEELMYLYRRAAAFVYPTKYEGFGLPVLEAMTLGCPVICSKVGSLPEVGGDAVRYADQQAEAYLEAMRELMDRSALRQQLIQAGFGQAAQFSWKKCATETVEVYRHVN